MKRILGLTLLIFAAYTIAYPQAKPNELVPKDTPASQTLNQLAKDKATDQKVWDTKLQQARFNLDQQQKVLNDQLQTVQKDLNAKLQADKKYKPMLDQIADAQKKLNDIVQSAQGNFARDSGAVQQKLNMENSNIHGGNGVKGLIDVVRAENGFPDSAIYDDITQKWSAPAPEPAKAPERK